MLGYRISWKYVHVMYCIVTEFNDLILVYTQELEIEVEMLRDDKRKLMKDKLSVQTELDDYKCKQMDSERVSLVGSIASCVSFTFIDSEIFIHI